MTLLYVGGVVQILAAPAILFPAGWMAGFHDQLGIGELPELPIVSYLTRTLSALYVAWGALYLFIVRDLERYLPLLCFVAWTKVCLGALFIAIDIFSGMPWYWTLGEGPIIIIFSLLVLWLANLLNRSLPLVSHQPSA